jgi:chlorobactene glucosyltransferase
MPLQALLANPLFLLSWGIILALVFILLLSILNAVTFPRLKLARLEKTPLVSILVPARNEAENIQVNLRSWLSQDYPNYEVILLDDNSEDRTYQMAQVASEGDTRFILAKGEPLPDGWLGKNWACHQLALLARGNVLLFTDADIHWQPGALSAVMAAFEKYHADACTVWPTQQTISFSERLVVPMMMFVVLGYLPEIFVRRIPLTIFAAANGQCLAFTRQAYQRIGGHAAVSNEVVEDVAMSRLVKRNRLQLIMALGSQLITGRMYKDWSSVRRGFAKNILAGHASSPLFLLISAVFHWLLFLFPWIWLFLGLFLPQPGIWPIYPLAMIVLGLASRAVTAITANLRSVDTLWMPISVILMSLIAGQSLVWHFRDGGPQWKGRIILHDQRRQIKDRRQPRQDSANP